MTDHEPEATAAGEWSGPTVLTRNAAISLALLALGVTVMLLNETSMVVAIPVIMEDFSIPATAAQWLITGFMLTMAVVIPTTGYLLERFPTRILFTTALGLFLIGAIVAAAAPMFWVLLLGRVIQAAGTAITMPILMTTAMTVVPAHRRGTVMGVISVVISLAPALGPAVGGLILHSYTWHYIFMLMISLLIVLIIATLMTLKNVGETRQVPLDLVSVVLSAFAFGGLIYGLSSMEQILHGSGRGAVGMFVVGAANLFCFVYRQRELGKNDRALMDLGPFKIRNFTASTVLLCIVFGLMLGTVTTLPIFLQSAVGVTALVAGLVVLPGGVLQGLVGPILGRIYDAVGPRPLLIPGTVVLTLSLLGIAFLGADTSPVIVGCCYVIFALGVALTMSALFTTALGSLPMHLYGHGSAILNTLQQLAGATGTAVLIATLSTISARKMAAGATAQDAAASGAHWAFLVAAAIGLVTVIFSPTVRKIDLPAHSVDLDHPAERD